MAKVSKKLKEELEQVNTKKIYVSNILTNAAFAVGGLVVYFKFPSDYSALFAVVAILLAAASAAHHTFYKRGDSLAKAAQAADETGMYAVLLVMIASVAGLSPVVGIPVVIILTTLAAVYYRSLDSHELIPWAAVFLAGGVFAQGFAIGLVTTGLMGIAFLANMRDHPKYHGPMHGAWHILSAFAITLTFIFTA